MIALLLFVYLPCTVQSSADLVSRRPCCARCRHLLNTTGINYESFAFSTTSTPFLMCTIVSLLCDSLFVRFLYPFLFFLRRASSTPHSLSQLRMLRSPLT